MSDNLGDSRDTHPPSQVQRANSQTTCRYPSRRDGIALSKSTRFPLQSKSTNNQLQPNSHPAGHKDPDMFCSLAQLQALDGDIFGTPTRLHSTCPEPASNNGYSCGTMLARTESRASITTPTSESPEAISNKIRLMLAASEALKPGSGRLADFPEAKSPRAVSSKVLKKISKVWTRFHARNGGKSIAVRSRSLYSPR